MAELLFLTFCNKRNLQNVVSKEILTKLTQCKKIAYFLTHYRPLNKRDIERFDSELKNYQQIKQNLKNDGFKELLPKPKITQPRVPKHDVQSFKPRQKKLKYHHKQPIFKQREIVQTEDLLTENNSLIHYLSTFEVEGNISTAFQTLERYNHIQRELKYREVLCDQFELHSSTYDRIVILLGRRCIKCGSQYSLTIHHIVPKSANGSNGFENLQLVCRDCHSDIHDISRKEITIAGITGIEV